MIDEIELMALIELKSLWVMAGAQPSAHQHSISVNLFIHFHFGFFAINLSFAVTPEENKQRQ